jgi:2',3'-cyclic-nucleotide 2'-phosphodiesterase/3'-nucleotidase
MRLISALLFTLAIALTPASAETLRLRLLETSDIHGYLMAYDYYRDQADATVGLAKIATLVSQARTEAPNTLLLDAGDLIQGNSLDGWAAVESQPVHPAFVAMNLMRYDAATLGNHEFNFGLDVLDRALKGAKFPYVSANALDAKTGKPRWQPYVILDRVFIDEAGRKAKLKIGVIGGVTPQIMVWDHDKLDGKLTTVSISQSIAKLAPEMKAKGADMVIAVVHSGLSAAPAEGLDENAGAYLAHIPGIDAVLTGHQHRIFPGPAFSQIPDADLTKGAIAGVPVVMPGYWGSHLGVVDLTFERRGKIWTRTDGVATTRPIYKREGGKVVSLVEADPRIVQAIADAHAKTLEYARRPVGRIDRPIESYFGMVADDAGMAVIARVEREEAARALKGTKYESLPLLAAASLFRVGGQPGPENFTRIPAGPVALKNVADLYPYANTLTAIVVTGAQLREWLERSAGIFKRIDPNSSERQKLIDTFVPAYNFDVITGLTYAIDVSQPARYGKDGEVKDQAAHRILDLRYNGQPIDEAQRFVVATNNYRASGGGSFPGLAQAEVAFQSPETVQELIARRFASAGAIDATPIPAWRFASLGKPVQAVFESAPAAEARLAEHPGIRALGETTPEGFALFAIDLQ